MTGLCETCKGQNDFHYGNFDHLASEELPRSHRVTIRLGSLSDISSRAKGCQFCSLVVSAIATAWDQPTPSLAVDGVTVDCELCNRVVGVVSKPGASTEYHENFRANDYQYTNCRLVVECRPAPPGYPSRVEIQALDSGADVKGLFDDAALFTRRPSRQMKTIDFELLKKWLSSCTKTHRGLCDPDTVPDTATDTYLKYFRLIDVHERRIVNAGPGDEYAALSYVWGRAPVLRLVSSTSKDLHLKGALGAKNKDVPKTIRDAIQATSELGMRYLWVDALCIMQDDVDEKVNVIGAMDLVYSRAALTIVAASGSHANAGLAGMTGSRDLEPFEDKATFSESSRQFTVARSRPSDLLDNSPWNRRGWTYQERLCSHRMLIFTEQQVAYVCGGASWCEDTVLETDDPRVHYEEKPLHSLNLPNDATRSFMQKVESAGSTSPFQEYEKLVSAYSSRDLTFPGDVQDAFAGGLSRFQRNCGLKGIQLNFLFGLPELWLELGLLWELTPGLRGWKRREGNLKLPSGLEVPFPSWSWMGWMGAATAEAPEHGIRPEVDWFYIEPGSNAIRRIHSEASSHPPPFWFQTSDASRLLREKWRSEGAATVVEKSNLDPFPAADLAGKLAFYTSTSFLSLGGQTETLSGPANEYFIGTDEAGRIRLDPEWAEARIGQSFEFIVLARQMVDDWKDPGMCDLLGVCLVEQDGPFSRRVGVGYIDESAWAAAKTTWRLVLLG